MKGLIGGTSLLSSGFFAGWAGKMVETPYGPVPVQTRGDWVFLQRHGDPPTPPHKIDHRANIEALRLLAVEKIVSFNSTGSLKKALKPGMFLIPDDFFCPWQIPTFFDEEMRFTVPAMDATLGSSFFLLCEKLLIPAVRGGTYVQTIGPRFETKAEIMVLRGFGDVVGMTMASEATLCGEVSIPYASICAVDNFCNGIASVTLTLDEIIENGRQSTRTFEVLIHALLEQGLP
jgi:5'-methylthioadenosine phosphorylase